MLSLLFQRTSAEHIHKIDALHERLIVARRDRAIVCTTPEVIKSIMLKFIEFLVSVQLSPTPAQLLADAEMHPDTVQEPGLMRQLRAAYITKVTEASVPADGAQGRQVKARTVRAQETVGRHLLPHPPPGAPAKHSRDPVPSTTLRCPV